MKIKLFLILLMVFYSKNTYSQKTTIKTADSIGIYQNIKTIQLFLKNSDIIPIKNIFYNKVQASEEQIFKTLNQLPKGILFIEKISVNKKNGFIVVVQIKPFGIPLIIEMDVNYSIKNITKVPESNYNFIDDYNLEINKIELPFHLIDGFIMVDGEVNEKKGKFLFDTGTPFGLLLNNHFLDLQKKELIASGNANSGQNLDIYVDSAHKIKIGTQVNYAQLQTVPNSDFSFIEKGIEHDFLGFIGFDFIKNYEFIIDYDYQIITLYKLDKNGSAVCPYTLTNTEIVKLPFTTTKQKQIPIVAINIGQISIKTRFDTGNQGSINLNNSTLNQLLQQEIIHKGNEGSRYGETQDNSETYTINQLSYGLTSLLPVKNFYFTESSENDLGFGYQFLKNYLTIWNFQKKIITLLQK